MGEKGGLQFVLIIDFISGGTGAHIRNTVGYAMNTGKIGWAFNEKDFAYRRINFAQAFWLAC